ncbi:peptide MFS transporter [Micrococcus sp. FDAARGOS_333]|uniref:peptide MFS transporter n=1 Tax=Micrococcus sp. FDAARGOS_333 TaxID=1930558 RepID=UPI000B4E540A|nr:peptide MFS transporter [Micrococcus sp. FDAARGOS_333]PNL18203.1 peptide MFS transporter [Micrococcus sp. FDAARGOS_333]
MKTQNHSAASSPTPPQTPNDAPAPTAGEGRTFFGQPRQLASLFSVEMWERFSFYGMQVMLVYYMSWELGRGGLGMDEAVATGIVGAYGGLVYVFCILGGWVADRLLGSERTMFYSAVLIMLGHIALALVSGFAGLALGLVLVAVGSGGLKANAANLVGALYSRQDPRRDAGFSLFYMGVNVGALIGPLVTGAAREAWGFHLGFGLAAVGMAIGLVQYAVARRSLPREVHAVPDRLPRSQYGRTALVAVAGLAAVAVLFLTGVVNVGNLADAVVVVAAVAAVAIFAVLLRSEKVTAEERSRVKAFIPLFIGSAVFFALFQQQFTVIALYSEQRLDRSVFGWDIPMEWVNSINPVFIILFAPVFAALWTRLGRRQPVTPAKFGLGLIAIGIAFLLFIPMASVAAVPLLWLTLILFVATVGELLVSPVGLSLSTKVAPAAFPVLMVALYNLSVALGTAAAGSLSGSYSADNEVGYFGVIGAVTVGVGVLMLVIAKPVHRAMRGID